MAPAPRATSARSAAAARQWRPVALPATAHGQPQPPAATRAGQPSGQRSQDARRLAQPQRVDANGSMWRLRSLIAMGHTTQRIAAALGTTTATISPLIGGRRGSVAVPLRDDISKLFDAWWDKHPPQQTPADKTAMIRALGDAAVRNWPCPAALNEDELDTPGYQPTDRWRYSKGTGPATEDPLGKQRDPATKQAHPGRAAAQAERDTADAGWRIPASRHPGRQAEAEREAV